jgi:4-amino-4-deoxy-L-arabinose transferase-like glycosyltransferase
MAETTTGRKFSIALLLAITAYATFLFVRGARVAGGSDSSGYLNSARALARRQTVEKVTALDRMGLDDSWRQVFIPLGYVPGPRPGTMSSYYPPGLPLQMAAAGALFGWNSGPFWIVPLSAAISVLLIVLLALDMGLSRGAAGGAGFILAVHPAFLFMALQPMSDIPATLWALLAIFSARRALEKPMWAYTAGVGFGMAFLVRPANVLLLIPLGFLLGIDVRRYLRFFLGGLPLLVFFLAYNRVTYGGWLMTGYSVGGLHEAFAWSNFYVRLKHYSHWLSATLSGLLLAGWLVAPFDRKIGVRDRWVLGSWFLAFFLFYDFFGPYDAWWYMRYLLPAFPPLILAFLLVGRDAARSLSRYTRAPIAGASLAAAGLLVVSFIELRQVRRLRFLDLGWSETRYSDSCLWAAKRLPANAVVITMQSSGALKYYTALSFARYDWLDAERAPKFLAAAKNRGLSVYALLWPSEIEDLLKRVPGQWTKLDEMREVSIWAIAVAPTR